MTFKLLWFICFFLYFQIILPFNTIVSDIQDVCLFSNSLRLLDQIEFSICIKEFFIIFEWGNYPGELKLLYSFMICINTKPLQSLYVFYKAVIVMYN